MKFKNMVIKWVCLMLGLVVLTSCGCTKVDTDSSSEVEIIITDFTAETEETTTETTTETTAETTVESSETTTELSETTIETTPVTNKTTTATTTTTTTTATTTITTTAEPVIKTVESTVPTVVTKTNEEIAQEVWQGLWGIGCDRKNRLEAAGYNYNDVQKIVDEIGSALIVKTVIDTKIETQTQAQAETKTTETNNSFEFVKTFTKGTFYAYGGPRKGGSGRQLIDCSQGDGTVKGSIASRYLYDNYGYNYNGNRTKVYLEVEGYEQMNGYYYLDDSCAPGYNNVIDFFYLQNSNCPFCLQGVVTVQCYIVK